MSDLEVFRLLKKEVLLAYQKHFPYFRGNWKTFSTQDIRQLIDAVEESTNQRISEKWIYTYLKKEHPKKLPRKDMLDILSRFAGFSGWDEFSVKARDENKDEKTSPNGKKLRVFAVIFFVLVNLGIIAYLIYSQFETKETKETTETTGTNKPVEGNSNHSNPKTQKPTEKSISSEKNDSVLAPTRKKEPRSIQKNEENPKPKPTPKSSPKHDKKSVLSEKDYKLILKTFIKSDLRDWKTRKQQLDKMLSENLEVVVVLKNGLGAEYFNKTDFSQKLIIPTESIKTMKITELKTNAENKIRFIRITQN